MKTIIIIIIIIIIVIIIIIINIYINLLFTTDSLKKVILISESYLCFFKPNTGAMQCLIKVAESQVHHEWAVSRSIQETQWMNVLLFAAAIKTLKKLCIKNDFQCSTSLSCLMITSRNYGVISSNYLYHCQGLCWCWAHGIFIWFNEGSHHV